MQTHRKLLFYSTFLLLGLSFLGLGVAQGGLVLAKHTTPSSYSFPNSERVELSSGKTFDYNANLQVDNLLKEFKSERDICLTPSCKEKIRMFYAEKIKEVRENSC